MASPEWKLQRQMYEFSKETKFIVREEQDHKCAISGYQGPTEVHHMLGAALAHGYFPSIDPRIFSQRENAVALSPKIHDQLHREMEAWPPEFTKLFVIGMYKYLREIYQEKQTKIEQHKAILGSGGKRRL